MARLKSNLLESGMGKIGNIVFYYRNGVPCARAIPNNYHDKKSEAQLKQRQKMQLVHDFIRPFSDFIRMAFKEEQSSRTGYQSAQSYHLKNAIEGEYPNQYINKNVALLSKGAIELPNTISYSENDSELVFTWDTTKSIGAMPTDMFIVLIRYKDNNGEYFITGTQRFKGEYRLYKEDISFNIEDIYVAFRSYDETKYSNSYCLTSN